MAREDGDFIRTVYQAFNRAAQSGDLAPWIEAFFDQEVEWRLAEDQPDAGPFRGHEGVKRLFDGWLEAWEDWALEPRSSSKRATLGSSRSGSTAAEKRAG